MIIILYSILSLFVTTTIALSQNNDRIKGNDEPQIVSYRVLEGVTEPFEAPEINSAPLWKTMKESADGKAAQQLYQESLHEYGQILKNPFIFGDVPSNERYDIFLTMSKLLKIMGFFEKAEILLYEAMSYTQEPYDAHYQLGLLLLDKEDLNGAKVHFKNCLFYKESDINILVYLSVILIAEGKMYEANFYISRILISLEQRVHKLSTILGKDPSVLMGGNEDGESMDYQLFFNNLEDLFIKVFRGEFIFIPNASLELFRFFGRLYEWLDRGEMAGRFVFDLGQALHERGKPDVGKDMMARGHATENVASEGVVSSQIVKLRLAMEFPAVPSSISDIFESYLNITDFLSSPTPPTRIGIENVIDTFWPLPLMWWSGIAMAPVMQEYVEGNFVYDKTPHSLQSMSMFWIRAQLNSSLCPQSKNSPFDFSKKSSWNARDHRASKGGQGQGQGVGHGVGVGDGSDRGGVGGSGNGGVGVAEAGGESRRINLGIIGGHFNSHLVGMSLLHHILRSISAMRYKFNVILIALPLVPDHVTEKLASLVDRIVNIPPNTQHAWSTLTSLFLDVVMFPDWQPFPDQQSVYFQSERIAPVQICFYVRGSSCSFSSVDYYLLPSDMQMSYTADQSDTATSKWRELFSEQVVLLSWPVFTPAVVGDIYEMVLATEAFEGGVNEHGDDAAEEQVVSGGGKESGNTGTSGPLHSEDRFNLKPFLPREYEGKVFFSGQPVAVIPFHPSYVHPLMDEVLYSLLRTVPNLLIVIAVPEIYAKILPSSTSLSPSFSEFRNAPRKVLSIEWGKRLARRLWSNGGNLHQRIRLLPAPLSDFRLLQLIRQSDLVLDSFPIGSSLHPLSLALSVGTPIVTFRGGTLLRMSAKEGKDIIRHVNAQRFQSNRMYQYALHYSDLPWRPTISTVAPYFSYLNLSSELVVNSTQTYISQAARLVSDREWGYDIRVRLLDAVDGKITSKIKNDATLHKPVSGERDGVAGGRLADNKEGGGSRGGGSPTRDNAAAKKSTKKPETELERFLYRVGSPWAEARVLRSMHCKNMP